MTERSYRLLFWCLALLGLSLDQASKYGVFHMLYNEGLGAQQEIVPKVFRLVSQFEGPVEVDPEGGLVHMLRTLGGEAMPAVNHGALWGLGGEYKHLANGIFALVSVAAAAAIIFWSTRRTMARDWKLCAALGLILAGTFGNLYDRLVFHGVRDFLHFYWIEWPVFNVADCCLVCGAGLLLIQALWNQAPASDQPVTAQLSVADGAEVKSV